MPRPFLLFVDGDPARTPSLIQAMEQDGWRVEWARGSMTPGALKEGLTPDLMVVDPGNSGSGFDLVKMLRGQTPKLPVLVMTEGNTHHGIEIPVQGFLQRNQADAEIAAAVRRFRPGSEKLSTEDLFGDLLEDLGESPVRAAASPSTAPPPYVPPPPPAAPAPAAKPEAKSPLVRLSSSPAIAPLKMPPAPKAPVPAPAAPAPKAAAPAAPKAPAAAVPTPPSPIPTPVPAETPTPTAPLPAVTAPAPVVAAKPAPAPQKLMSQQDLFGDLVEELEAAVPAAAGRVAAGQTAPTAELPPVEPSDDESTLSGITGADDPFAWKSGEQTAHTPTPAPLASAPEAPLAPMEEYGNYYLLEKIAVGGMAELFKAQQRGEAGFRKIVAIKRILPHLVDNEDFVTMFIDEAKLAAQLTHPNIVQIFDLGKAGNSYYIAMEYVNGRDLRTLLRKVREYALPVPEAVAAFVVMKVAAALDYAHRKRGFDDRELKLVHRDISPQNILISSEGAVKLVDFGIAKAATKASHTVAGALKGKLLYMSPEQALGQPLDNRSDIYSLGLVLFEMLTGERCFQADSEMGVLEKVRLGRIADIRGLNPHVSKEMIDVVGKALQKHVDHRYPSARLMERDLRELLMKRGHIPTEHEVSEYVEAALLGPRERVETVMHARFPLPTMPLASMSGGHAMGQIHQHPGPSAKLPPLPLPEMDMSTGRPSGPGWLLPTILAVGVLIIGLLLYFSSR